jgi:DNA-binding SARP family transcriptional activator
MMPVEFYLLGPPTLRIAGQPTHLRSAKTLALLAYLALEPNTAHSREKLVGLLWGESPEAHARLSLRQFLYSIRQTLGDLGVDCLTLKKRNVAFRLQPDVWVDAVEFMALATREGEPPDALRRAAHLYRGLLLEGLKVFDSPAFEDWLFLRRDALKQHALSALVSLGL